MFNMTNTPENREAWRPATTSWWLLFSVFNFQSVFKTQWCLNDVRVQLEEVDGYLVMRTHT